MTSCVLGTQLQNDTTPTRLCHGLCLITHVLQQSVDVLALLLEDLCKLVVLCFQVFLDLGYEIILRLYDCVACAELHLNFFPKHLRPFTIGCALVDTIGQCIT
jgi:hypothetical protein